MATIIRFEDVEAWKFAREISKEVYALTRNDLLSKDFSLKDQVRRSSGSVMDNIAEGFERGGRKEFIQFLSIAKRSTAELKSQLYRCLDQSYMDKNQFNHLFTMTDKVGKMLGGLIKYLRSTDIKGLKFKESLEVYQLETLNPKPETEV